MGGRKPRTLMRKTLADIIEPRVEEIIALVHEEIKKSGYEKLLASGVVLTGGCANLEGLVELAEERFQPAGEEGLPHRDRRSRRCGEQSHIRHGSRPYPARIPGEQMEKRRL